MNSATNKKTFAIAVVATLAVAFGFQNCSQFKAEQLLEQSSNSFSTYVEQNIPSGTVVDPDTQTESTFYYIDDMALTLQQVTASISTIRSANAPNYRSGAIATSTKAWPSKKLYLKINPNIPWANAAQSRKVIDGVLRACDRWKAVSDITCIELTSTQGAPEDLPIVWVGLASVQFIVPATGELRFNTDGSPTNYCGMPSVTLTSFSCATVGYMPNLDANGVHILNSNGFKAHKTHFIGINPDSRHIDNEYTYTHEVGHLLGLSHVHNRTDRDTYLQLNPNFPSNFPRMSDFQPQQALTGNGDGFDFASMMAYRFQHTSDARFINYSGNLSQVMSLVSRGAFNPNHSEYNEWVRLSTDVSAGAFAYKTAYFEQGFAPNQSARLANGWFPSQKDALAAVELYGATTTARQACTFNGVSIPHGTRVGVYSTGQATADNNYCAVEPRICNNGVLSGSSNITACSARCNIAGQSLKIGDAITYYASATVPVGQTCNAINETCVNGKLGRTVAGSTTCRVETPTAPPPATCTTQLIGTSPVASGASITVRVSCSNVPAGATVRLMGTKNSVSDSNSVLSLNASGMSDTVINNTNANVAGAYVRYAEISSNTGTSLHRSANVSFTVQAFTTTNPTPPAVSCVFELVGTTPVASGASIVQRISCSNVPSGALLRLIGTKDGAANINQAISLNASNIYEAPALVNNAANLAGTYQRYVQVSSSTGSVLHNSSPVSFVLQPYTATQPTTPPACTYQFTGNNPLRSGETGRERINCTNVPAGATVRLVGTRNGAPQINAVINLINGAFESEEIFNNDPAIAGTYVRHVEVASSTGTLLTSTPNYSVTVNTAAACTYAWDGGNPLLSGATGTERVSCTNLPAGGSVKLIGTRNGAPQIDAVLSLTNGSMASVVVNNDAAIAGTYTRHVQVLTANGRQMLVTPSLTVTVQAYTGGTGTGSGAACNYSYVNGGAMFTRATRINSGQYEDVYKCTQIDYMNDACSSGQSIRVTCNNGVTSEANISGSSCTAGQNIDDFRTIQHGNFNLYCSGNDYVGRKCLNGSFQSEVVINAGACYSGP